MWPTLPRTSTAALRVWTWRPCASTNSIWRRNANSPHINTFISAVQFLYLVTLGHPRNALGKARLPSRPWTSANGLGAVFDIQQSSDGYLWLTTSRGVL